MGATTPKDTIKNAEVPKDAKVIALILESMGVQEYEPRVINQFLEFMYRYVADVLQDAKIYSEHANRDKIELSDVTLAVQSRVNHSFTQPPPREILLELAEKKNSTPLPLISQKLGVLLPREQYCLTAPNYQIDPNGSGRIPVGAKRGREAISDVDTMNISDDEVSPPPPAQPTSMQDKTKPVSFTINPK